MFTLKIKKLNSNAKLPTYAHPGDVGMDLYSLESYDLKAGERHIFDLGFALEFPVGYGAFVKDKSSLPKNGGIHVLAGVYDAGYRGEYNVHLINLGKKKYRIEKGDKVAQLVIVPVAIPKIKEVKELGKTARGEGRFGSTGK
ncbi:MAG: dUTP diphosphatase [Candidatus Paceibacterota bacterium]|jgi:dUTP pyrophosphatase|nr:dUTP diphosphatase [Candidatus Paceibacterota bacterium]